MIRWAGQAARKHSFAHLPYLFFRCLLASRVAGVINRVVPGMIRIKQGLVV